MEDYQLCEISGLDAEFHNVLIFDDEYFYLNTVMRINMH